MTASMVPKPGDLFRVHWLTRPFNPDWVSPPGDTLLDWIGEQGAEVSTQGVAVSLEISLSEMADLLAGELEITDDLAGRLGQLCGSKTFWLNREDDYRRRSRRSESETGEEPQ